MRIIGSMTTLPDRLFKISKPIMHILNQSKKLDVLYLNITYKTRSGKKYDIPDNFLNQFKDFDTKVILNRCEDFGPITKLAPTLDIETESSTIILTFDDDIIVSKNLIETLWKKSKKLKNSSIGFSGICVGKLPFKFQLVYDNVIDTKVDILQGVHVILYKRSFFPIEKACDHLVNYWKNTAVSDLLFFNDDHHISAYLASHNVDRYSIGLNFQRYLYKYDEKQADALSLNFPKLILEHSTLINFFEREGLYKLSYNIFDSPFLILLLLFCVVLLSLKLCYSQNMFYLVQICFLIIAIKKIKADHSLNWYSEKYV